MEALARGDIVLFPFPYTDMSARKIRPCLVLSPMIGKDILLCQITSQQTRKDAYAVALKEQDTREGSLRIDSYIRTSMIFTAHTSQIRKKVCKINDAKYIRVVRQITKLITQ